jgi:hypothetical protein
MQDSACRQGRAPIAGVFLESRFRDAQNAYEKDQYSAGEAPLPPGKNGFSKLFFRNHDFSVHVRGPLNLELVEGKAA